MPTLGHLPNVQGGSSAHAAAEFGGSLPHVGGYGHVCFPTECAANRKFASAAVSLSCACSAAIFGFWRAGNGNSRANLAHYRRALSLLPSLQAGEPACLPAKQIPPAFYVSVRNVATSTASQARDVCPAPQARCLDQTRKLRVFFGVALLAQNLNVRRVASQFWVIGKRLNVVPVKLLHRTTLLAAARFLNALVYNLSARITRPCPVTTLPIVRGTAFRLVASPSHCGASPGAPTGAIGVLAPSLELSAALLADVRTNLHWHALIMHALWSDSIQKEATL